MSLDVLMRPPVSPAKKPTWSPLRQSRGFSLNGLWARPKMNVLRGSCNLTHLCRIWGLFPRNLAGLFLWANNRINANSCGTPESLYQAYTPDLGTLVIGNPFTFFLGKGMARGLRLTPQEVCLLLNGKFGPKNSGEASVAAALSLVAAPRKLALLGLGWLRSNSLSSAGIVETPGNFGEPEACTTPRKIQGFRGVFHARKPRSRQSGTLLAPLGGAY